MKKYLKPGKPGKPLNLLFFFSKNRKNIYTYGFGKDR